MKKLFIILLLFCASCTTTKTVSHLPFEGNTKHKPVKKMKQWELKMVNQSKETLYYRDINGNVQKSGRVYSGITRPKQTGGKR